MSRQPSRYAPLDIQSSQVGRVVAAREVDVAFRQSAAYGAAIGASRECYLDDRHPGGPLAPPFLITSLEWPLVSGPEHLAALGVPSTELFARLLHAFQDTRFHRALRVGDALRVEATLASVRPTNTGALTVLKLTTRERTTGSLVAESWFGSFFREAAVPLPATSLTAPTIEPFASASADPAHGLTLTRAHAHVYGECAGLWNPIHTEPSFAAATGFPDVAVHGTLLWAIAGERIIDRHLGGDPALLGRLAARFRNPIFPGRPLRLQDELRAGRDEEAAIVITQEKDGLILLDGLAQTRAGGIG